MAEPDHKRCLGCGYILDGLSEPRCPECGRRFDPDDARSYAVTKRRRSGRPALAAALVACAAYAAAYLSARSVNFNIRRAPPLSWQTIEWLSLGAMITAACVLAWSISALRRPPSEIRHLGAYVAAAVLGALVCLGFFWFNALPVRVLT